MIPQPVLDRLNSLDAATQGLAGIEGIYAVGSVALGDWNRRTSNIDVVVVTEASASNPPEERSWEPVVAAAHRTLSTHGQACRTAIISSDQLAASPETATGVCFLGRKKVAPETLINPFTFAVLDRFGVCVKGKEYPAVGQGDLRAWARDRLRQGWSVADEPGRRTWGVWLRRSTSEASLGTARLVLLARGQEVMPKAAAGNLLAADSAFRRARILKDSTLYREGARVSLYWGMFERRTDTLAIISYGRQEAG